jgi:signal peptidase I
LIDPPDPEAVGSELRLDGTAGPCWLVRRNCGSGGAGEVPITDALDYNSGLSHLRPVPVHDFVCAAEAEVVAGAGVLRLRLDDGGEQVTAELPAGEGGEARLLDRRGRVLVAGPSAGLSRGRIHRVEMAFVDRRATVAVDGSTVLPPVDLPAPSAARSGVARPLALGAEGVRATVRHLRLGRDVHYAATGTNGVGAPCQLGPDEYFLLGDNSAHSEDSRFWPRPGVPERCFLGKPFLLHQPSRWRRTGPADRATDVLGVDWPRAGGLH